MPIVAKHIYGAPLGGSDGRVGSVYDLLFDDRSWVLRHIVVNVDRWFLGRQVLLDPTMIWSAGIWSAGGSPRGLQIGLTKEQVRNSPSVETDLPVARQEAVAAAQVLVWEAYWTSLAEPSQPQANQHLRSTKMLTGLHIHCSDGPLGHVEDFLIDPQSWSVRDLIVDTRNWWPGKSVLIEPTLVEAIDWENREIRLRIPRDQVEHRPTYGQEEPAEETLIGTA
jgi:hypothetical protein